MAQRSERKLTDEQARAAEARERRIVVVAGAGTGKTTFIEGRYQHLVEHESIRPQQVMLVTFARKAAMEMRARVSPIAQRTDLSCNPDSLPIGTFHSLALREIRLDPAGFGLPSSFVVIDEDDAKDLWQEAAEELGGRTLPDPPGSLRRAYSFCRNSRRRFEEEVWATYGRAGDSAIELLEAYRAKKKTGGYADYDDLLSLLEWRLRKDPDWREDFRARTRAIVVDEYQDVNPLQESFLHNADPEWLGLVGDPNQSIYGWRGSSPDLILQKMTDPSFGRYPLSANFRCAVEHLPLANRLADDGVRLTSGTGKHGKLWLHAYPSREEELDAVAQAARRCEPDGDLAILARSRAPLQQIEERLLSLGVKNYRLRGALSVRDRTETKDVVAYFRVALNPHDFVAARRVFELYPGIGKKTAAQLADGLRKGKGFQPPEACGRIAWVFSRLADESSPMPVRTKILREEYERLLEERWKGDPAQLKRRKKILGDIAASASAAKSARAWIDVAALDRDAVAGHGDPDQKPKQTIELATIHAYKGAEKKRIWVIGANEGLFPLRNQPVQEEKRLAYVAATRATTDLVISSSREAKRSRFFPLGGSGSEGRG